MVHKKFIIRQIMQSPKQGILFVLCVALSLVTLVAVGGFSDSVNRTLSMDARTLHAGDIIIRSYDVFSEDFERRFDELSRQEKFDSAGYYEFYSVVRSPENEQNLLAHLKAVQQGYPFYGRVELASGKKFREMLAPGKIVVEKTLLDRLGISVGDRLKIGYATFQVADVVLGEPDRPVNIFSFGPRVFVSWQDLDAMDLVQQGSRIRRVRLLKVFDEKNLTPIYNSLSQAARNGQERVETYRTARSRFKRFLDDFLFFLNLAGLFILLVSGIGIQSACTAFLREKRNTVAILKTVGATSRFISLHFMAAVFLLGLAGTLIGTMAGLLLQRFLAFLLSDFLPPNLELIISLSGLIQGLLLGSAVVILFTFIPLNGLKNLKPVLIFRREFRTGKKGWPYYLAGAGVLALFIATVLWHMGDIEFGLWFAAGMIGLILLSALFTHGLFYVLKKIRMPSLATRQAVKGLFRPGNATRSVIVTLSASICLIFTIYLLEKNLDAAFIDSYPEDTPNLFFIDIQPSQVTDFSRILGKDVKFYPVIRARIVAVNGEKIDLTAERKKRSDNLSRVFNLTYRSDLLEDETIIDGDRLFQRNWTGPQVSVMDTVVEMKKMAVGDFLTFRIQGVPLEARISSIRKRTRETMNPFFYFVFQENILKDAPQTIFTAARVPEDQVSEVQTRIVSTFPNVSVIDASQALTVFTGLMNRLSRIIRLFALLSIVSGILIMVSATFATRAERMAESVYFKILGAGRKFILHVLTLENIFIAIASSLTALIISHAGSWLICHFVFDISYQPFYFSGLSMVAGSLLALTAVGLISSVAIIRHKPASFLRERHDE